jgi:uncharacterized hydrophobic protein (TIGR00271 family)
MNNKIIAAVKEFVVGRFNLNEDKADEKLIVERIRTDVHFKGANLWALIFAIFIASIGLNVNSTSVVIGAMLISPLMGPIMGIGLGIGINDFDLVKKGAKNIIIAAVISVATSALYFSVSPLHETSSELLARTNPTVWDVFIALFGGLAGIVAGTRKEKGNVIPGVAIATALMPPLCTAGYGLATGKWMYFLGAFYLFFINSFFISIATFLIVKRLKFRKRSFATPETEQKVSRYILIIMIVTVLPSVYLAYRIVQRSIFESNAEKFVQSNFHFAKTQVVTHNYQYDGDKKRIELLLVGQELPESILDSIKIKLPAYGLQHTDLVIRQGMDAKQQIDLNAIKASVLEEVFAAERPPKNTPAIINKLEAPVPDIEKELKSLYPTLKTFSFSNTVFSAIDSARKDTITLFVGSFSKPFPENERKRMAQWLKERVHADSLRLVIE